MPIRFFTTFALSRGAVIHSSMPAATANTTTNTGGAPTAIKELETNSREAL